MKLSTLVIWAILCLTSFGCKPEPTVSSNELFEDREIVEGLKPQERELVEEQKKL